MLPENNFCSGRNPGAPSTPEEYLIVDGAHEIYSRKVFVGGLPIDVSEGELVFGALSANNLK